jgi:predicted TIM-barrel fold metal-dependent hydrolase
MIIDAHHHLWDKSRFNYSWLAQVPDIDRNFLIADYEESIRGTGVVKSVFVQADVDPQFALQETRWVLSLAEAATPIEGVVAWAPVEDPALDD